MTLGVRHVGGRYPILRCRYEGRIGLLFGTDVAAQGDIVQVLRVHLD